MKRAQFCTFLVLTTILLLIWTGGCGEKRGPTAQPTVPGSTPAPSQQPSATEDDRAAFESGLVSSARGALDLLPGASLYYIDLLIPDDFFLLQGHQKVHYTNQEDTPLDTVYFRLFPNIAGGAATVSAVQVNGQTVEPVYEHWDSALRVPLPAALPPGEQAVIEMDFEVEVAWEMGGNYGLFGYFDGVLVLDSFYPVIPVYDDEGWNVEDPPPDGDLTYFDASFYLVRVTAPADLTIVASGIQVSQEDMGNDQVLTTLAAGPARDFYLAASDNLIVVSETVGETTVNSYAFPEWEQTAELALQAAVDTLGIFSERLGSYPYTEFDVVGTPMLALGIEYPGMTGITLKVYDPDAIVWGLPSAVMLESTVAHEVAHQWFYNAVGNDQVDEPWLDEALSQYATWLYYVDMYGQSAAEGYRDSWDDRWSSVDWAEIPVGLPSRDYAENEYAPIIYGRGPIFVTALAEEMGQETFDDFLRDYCESYQWGIGTGDAFKHLAEQHCQCDLTALFEEWVYPAPPADTLVGRLEGLDIDEFFAVSYQELLLRNPEYVIEAGLAADFGVVEAELTDVSDAYIRQTQQMYVTILDMLRQYDRAALSPEQQITYDVYEWYLDDMVRGQEFMYYDYPITHFITGIQNQLIHFFTDIHPVTSKEDAEDYITRLSMVDTKFEQIIEGLQLREQAGVVSPRFIIQWSLSGIRSMARALAAYTPFYSAFEEKITALEDINDTEKQELLDAAEEAIEQSVLPAFQALTDYLEDLESRAPTDDGVWQFSNGAAYYDYLLRHFSTTDMSAEEIHQLGLQELERIHAEMRVLFDQLGYPQDESLVELYDRVARDGGYVSGSRVVETHEAYIEQADQNLSAAFDILPQVDVIVIGGPTGGFYVPASLDGSRPGAFYADTSGATKELYAMPSLTYHETIPGHHLQIAIAQEMDMPLLRNDLGFTAYVEGWALYAERLAWELGWYDEDVYGNLGRLQYEAFRAARLVVDTGIHTQGWTFDQAVEFMVENVGYDSTDNVNAEFEVSRYIAWPGQATSYMIGMLKILDLRQQAMDQLGEQFDLVEFHNVVLSNGSMPLEILEQVVGDYIESKLGQ